MEAKDDTGISSSGFLKVTSDVTPRTDSNPNQTGGSSVPFSTSGVIPPEPEPEPEALRHTTGYTCFPTEKKRGRPRKYASDGSLLPDFPLSPIPISSVGMKDNVRPIGSAIDDQGVSCPVGTNFAAHIVNVNVGEDVISKITSFSQQEQGSRVICILSAKGSVSNVSLLTSCGTLTFEGLYEIMSLTASFTPCECEEGVHMTCGGMSVSLVNQDGRVVGGEVAGLLEAATPIWVLVGSVPTGNQNEGNPKKSRLSTTDDSLQQAGETPTS